MIKEKGSLNVEDYECRRSDINWVLQKTSLSFTHFTHWAAAMLGHRLKEILI